MLPLDVEGVAISVYENTNNLGMDIIGQQESQSIGKQIVAESIMLQCQAISNVKQSIISHRNSSAANTKPNTFHFRHTRQNVYGYPIPRALRAPRAPRALRALRAVRAARPCSNYFKLVQLVFYKWVCPSLLFHGLAMLMAVASFKLN